MLGEWRGCGRVMRGQVMRGDKSKEGITSIISQKFFRGKASGLVEEGGGFVSRERLRGRAVGDGEREITVGCSGSRGFSGVGTGRRYGTESGEKIGMGEIWKTGRAGRGGPSRGEWEFAQILGPGFVQIADFYFRRFAQPRGYPPRSFLPASSFSFT